MKIDYQGNNEVNNEITFITFKTKKIIPKDDFKYYLIGLKLIAVPPPGASTNFNLDFEVTVTFLIL